MHTQTLRAMLTPLMVALAFFVASLALVAYGAGAAGDAYIASSSDHAQRASAVATSSVKAAAALLGACLALWGGERGLRASRHARGTVV